MDCISAMPVCMSVCTDQKKASNKAKGKDQVKPTGTPVNQIFLTSTDYHILINIQL